MRLFAQQTRAKIERQVAFSGTKEVADPLRFDAARLEAYLTQHVRGFKGPLTVSQFKGGQSNPTYLLTTPARRYVLRRKPPGKLLPSAHAVDREFRVISALSAQGFPVAAPVLYCDDTGVVGTAFYVMGFDPAAIGLADFGRGENYVARQVDRWSKQYRASMTQDVAEMEQLMRWLPEHLPPPAPVRVVHGDYRLDNMVLARDAPKVLAVLDWELATLGDPLADFSYHLMQWVMPRSETGADTGSLVGLDLDALGLPSLREYVDAYAARTGLDPSPHLAVYLAYNFFRLAAIVQGIVGRVRDGTATSEHAAARAVMVRPLAEKAWGFAQEAGA